jgi:hypothetical protein
VTTFTLRHLRGIFVVSGPDIEPVMFKSRREARDWCAEHLARGRVSRRAGRTSPWPALSLARDAY